MPLLLEVAKRAGIGLEIDAAGEMIVYADDIRRMPVFAAALLKDRHLFDELRFPDVEAGDADTA